MLENASAPGKIRRPWVLKVLLIASILGNVLFVINEGRRVIRKGGSRYILESFGFVCAPIKPLRLSFQEDLERGYRELPPSSGGVIFAGDSLAHGGPWAEVFGTVRNRGIGGETTSGLLSRLGEITARHPDVLVLILGTNDLAAERPIAGLIGDYRRILGQVVAETPETRVFVVSIPPVDQKRSLGPFHDNATIADVNAALRSLLDEYPTTRFVDVHEILAGSDGRIRDEYTTDGLHLTLAAYLRICEAIGPLIRGSNPEEY